MHATVRAVRRLAAQPSIQPLLKSPRPTCISFSNLRHGAPTFFYPTAYFTSDESESPKGLHVDGPLYSISDVDELNDIAESLVSDDGTGQSSAPEKLPIPELPPPVSGWPTPHVTDGEFSTYIIPLYAYHWGVTYDESGPGVGAFRRPQISRRYEFKGFGAMIEFLNEIAGTARTESHHPHYIKLYQNKLSVTYQTHSACRPDIPALGDTANGPAKPPVEPGITMRDIRSAILVETIFRTYITDGRGMENADIRAPRHRPVTVADIGKILKGKPDPKTRVPQPSSRRKRWTDPRTGWSHNLCPCCEGEHEISVCPSRMTKAPPVPCKRCGGSHWNVDCPFKMHVPPVLPVP